MSNRMLLLLLSAIRGNNKAATFIENIGQEEGSHASGSGGSASAEPDAARAVKVLSESLQTFKTLLNHLNVAEISVSREDGCEHHKRRRIATEAVTTDKEHSNRVRRAGATSWQKIKMRDVDLVPKHMEKPTHRRALYLCRRALFIDPDDFLSCSDDENESFSSTTKVLKDYRELTPLVATSAAAVLYNLALSMHLSLNAKIDQEVLGHGSPSSGVLFQRVVSIYELALELIYGNVGETAAIVAYSNEMIAVMSNNLGVIHAQSGAAEESRRWFQNLLTILIHDCIMNDSCLHGTQRLSLQLSEHRSRECLFGNALSVEDRYGLVVTAAAA